MNRKRFASACALALAALLVPAANAAAAEPPDEPARVSVAATPTDQLEPSSTGAQVINGQRTTVSENPSVITGIRVGGGGPQGQSCTASVVAERKIITAAHCMIDVSGAKSYIYGDDDLNTPGDETFRTEVESFKTHPNYGGAGGWQTGYDVAVVTTAADIPVPQSQWAKVAGSEDSALTEPGNNGTVLGYGLTSPGGSSGVLYKTTLPVNDASGCQVFNIRVNPELMVCTGYNDGRTGTCSGDSGGPFTVDGVVVGVVSWGGSQCERYSIMARLTNEMGDWARGEIGQQPGDGEFGVSVSPSSGTVEPGQSVSAAVRSTAGEQGPEELALSAGGLPAGTTAVFQPETINSGDSAKLTFDTAASTPEGTYRIEVTAAGTTGTKTAAYTLTVGQSAEGPRPTVSPGTLTTSRGGFANATVTVAGGTGSSRLTATGLTFNPFFFPESVSPGGTSQMTVFAPFDPGTYPIKITATDSAGVSGTTELTLIVT